MEQKVISIVGPSGGVGKSTIAKELAVAYSNTCCNGKPLAVCIIDANLGLGSHQALFKLAPKYFIEDWIHDLTILTKSKGYQYALDTCKWDHIERYLSYSDEHRLFVLPTCMDWYIRNNQDPGAVSGSVFNVLLLALKKYFDVIIIDTGNNMSEITFAAMAFSDRNLLLLSDEKRCLTAIGKLKQVLRDRRIPFQRFTAVLNQYPEKKSEQIYTVDELNQILLDIRISHIINYDKRVWTFNNMNDALILHPSSSKIKSQLGKLAKDLVPEFTGNT